MAEEKPGLVFKLLGLPFLLLLITAMAVLGCGSVYCAIRIRVAGEWHVARISNFSYANLSRVSPDMTYIWCEGHEYIWSTTSHKKVAIGDSVALLLDPATGVGAAFPLGASKPTFFAIADKVVYPLQLWILPIIFTAILIYSAVHHSIAAFRWLHAPFGILSQPSTGGTRAIDPTGIAEAVSHAVRRAVVLILLAVTAIIIGRGLFYVHRFSIIGVGLYFTSLTVILSLPLPEWGAAMTRRLRSPFFFAGLRILVSCIVLGLFIRKAAIFLQSDLTRFDTIGDLLWDFVETLVS